MRPVVDTLQLAFSAAPTAIIQRAETLSKLSCNPPTGKEAETPWLETPEWSIGPARLEGHVSFDHLASGRGRMTGIRVLWGPSREAGPLARRFKLIIGSEVLWRHYANGGGAATAAREIVDLVVGKLWLAAPAADRIAVRRVDVCVDHWGYTWTRADLDRFACRQQLRGATETWSEEAAPESTNVFDGATSSTYYVGGRGAASRFLRVYDKVAEAMASGKLPWMEPIWRQNGWDGNERVWRAEIEHGGEWLRAHGFDSIDKLDGCEAILWAHYLDHVRHTTGRRTRAKRSPTSRVWKKIGTAIIADALIAARQEPRDLWQWQPRPPRAGGDMKILEQMIGGCGRKIDAAMFHGDRARLLSFINDALDRSEARARQRQAKLALTPRPPPRPKPGART